MGKKKKRARYSNPINGTIINMIRLYSWMLENNTVQNIIMVKAIDDSLLELLEDKDYGERKRQAVQMVYIDKTHTYEGAALELYVSPRTVQYWLADFVKAVGKKAGYIE